MYPNTSLIKGISKKWCVITLFKQFSWDLAFTLKKKKKKKQQSIPFSSPGSPSLCSWETPVYDSAAQPAHLQVGPFLKKDFNLNANLSQKSELKKNKSVW